LFNADTKLADKCPPEMKKNRNSEGCIVTRLRAGRQVFHSRHIHGRDFFSSPPPPDWWLWGPPTP